MIAPAVPRRTCTLPRRGCVTVPNTDRSAPPAPGVRVVRVTREAIDIAYNLGTDLGQCQPESLRVAVYVTVSGLPPYGEDYRVASSAGSLRIKQRRPSGTENYGPADILVVQSTTGTGLGSESARVALPPPEGERRLSDVEVRRIKAHREACRGDIDNRTSCEMGGLHPVSGPVTEATPAQLTRSVRDSLKAYGGFSVLHVKCVDGTRCRAAFAIDGRRLVMSYRIQALKAVPMCWELTAFRVTRPVPELGNFAAPLPQQGCVQPSAAP